MFLFRSHLLQIVDFIEFALDKNKPGTQAMGVEPGTRRYMLTGK
jgi:hypothetical protein